MRVCLTPSELAEIVTGAARDETGMICLEIPDACVQREAPRLVLAHPQIVRYDDRHAILTPTQHALVRLLLSRGGCVDFDEAKAAVWLDTDLEDVTVRAECSRASRTLRKACIPFKLSTKGSVISLQDCNRNATDNL